VRAPAIRNAVAIFLVALLAMGSLAARMGAVPVAAQTSSLGTATVTAALLNLRSGPGLTNPVVAAFPSGKAVAVTGNESAGGWCPVSINGVVGWMNAAYLSGCSWQGSAAATPSTSSAQGAAPASPHIVILVFGAKEENACAVGTGQENLAAQRYSEVGGALAGADQTNVVVLGFSYSGQYYVPGNCALVSPEVALQSQAPSMPSFTADDTCKGAAPAANLLQAFVHDALAANPGAVVDLVGFSLGGVVASYYTTLPAAAPDLQRVHSITLLDSPVQGFSPSVAENLLNSVPSFFGNDKIPCDGQQTWTDLQPGSEVISGIAARAEPVKPFRGPHDTDWLDAGLRRATNARRWV